MKKHFLSVFVLLYLGLFQMQSQDGVTIYWDASYSMKDRKIDREFNYLDNYFRKFSNMDVRLVMFSNDIILEENFKVEDGNWSLLKRELENTIYDGATSFAPLFKQTADAYLLFTDGDENLDKLEPPVVRPISIISTVKNNNAPRLKRIADASNGSYVVLSQDLNKPQTTKGMTFDKKEDGLIEGVVTNDGAEFLPLVNIVNKRTNKSATSGPEGAYRIEAEIGDVLVFTLLGKRTVNVRVVADIMNIRMTDINEVLDEVVVEAEVEKEELVNTGNTTIDKKRLGYDVATISKDDISDLDTDVIGAVKGQFANLDIANPVYDKVDLSQFTGRGRNMTMLLNQYGLIVVDGVPQEQSNSGFGTGFGSKASGLLDPAMIESITYLKGLAATNKYGTLGRNGVLLITTKNALSPKDKRKKEIPLGTTETYSENATAIEAIPNSAYLKAYKKATTVEEAFEKYLSERERHESQAAFFIDSYDYFKGWNNAYLSDRVISNIYELFFDNTTVLRALAYKQLEAGNPAAAVFTYKRILKLGPDQAQSYRDLGHALVLNGQYQEAFKTYDRIDKNRGVGRAQFSGLRNTISNEFKNLIGLHKGNLQTAGVNPMYLKNVKHKARIVFEWNNPGTEFDLQIVNPQKRFFTWEHTKAKTAQRLVEEKQQGYGMEEFYLTSSDVGEWLFNVKYLGSGNSDWPSFLKVTIYKDFGQPNETMDVKVIRLSKKGALQNVVKLRI